jgi:hypothetical protein
VRLVNGRDPGAWFTAADVRPVVDDDLVSDREDAAARTLAPLQACHAAAQLEVDG